VTPPYTVRPVRGHEWREVRAVRLAALSDDAAPMAFLESYDDAARRPDEFWQDRARGSSLDAGHRAGARQFVAVADDGTWVGTATVLVERAGARDYEGTTIEEDGGHVVAVYLRPEHRGRGVMERLFASAADWLRELGLSRVRLHVHADNARAQGLYERVGFRPTGATSTSSIGPEIEMAMPL
jgi:GNAT superfamily N-acetyltransferase